MNLNPFKTEAKQESIKPLEEKETPLKQPENAPFKYFEQLGLELGELRVRLLSLEAIVKELESLLTYKDRIDNKKKLTRVGSYIRKLRGEN